MTVDPLAPYKPTNYRANWLGRYLKVEKDFEKDLRKALKEASTAVSDEFASVQTKIAIRAEEGQQPLRGTNVERVQIALAQNAIRNEIGTLFDRTEDMISQKRQDAAVAATNALLYDERGLLARIFDTEAERRAYADSLRATARRNVEALEQRLIQKPLVPWTLSERVWNTQALAQGRVDTAINNGLALGKSAVQIGNEVKSLINPDVPGGISYAAMRLGRTELGNAFHNQAIADAQMSPWIEHVMWNMTVEHEDYPGDPCEDYDQQLFRVEEIPQLPHPNCRCYTTPELPGWEEFSQQLLMGTYDEYLDAVMEGREPGEIELAPQPVGPVRFSQELEDCKSTEDIGYLLQDKYPNVIFRGWEDDKFHVEDARDAARGFDDVCTAFPDLIDLERLEYFNIGQCYNLRGGQPLAECGPEFASRGMPGWNSGVTLNSYHTDPDKRFDTYFSFQRAMAGDFPWHVGTITPDGISEENWYHVTVHELGHSIGFAGGDRGEASLDYRVRTAYMDYRQSTPSALDYTTWIQREAPSKYSMLVRDQYDAPLPDWMVKDPNPPEFRAESFVDVFVNKDEAKPLSKKENQILLDDMDHAHDIWKKRQQLLQRAGIS